MDVTVHRMVDWENDVYLRDEPYGDNAVELKPLQLDVLLGQEFPEGQSIRLPQPDASYAACDVVRHAQSWHFRQTGGRELVIPAEAWPAIVQQIRSIYAPTA